MAVKPPWDPANPCQGGCGIQPPQWKAKSSGARQWLKPFSGVGKLGRGKLGSGGEALVAPWNADHKLFRSILGSPGALLDIR
uniref:Uncharacterized protein n=1 Tax=Bionectria ochroleuca TaxID=29856 RepID=A0A8H7NJN6_BIOOC